MAYSDFVRETFKRLEYEPTEAQWPIHLDRINRKLIVGGERGGKSAAGSAEAVLKILRTVKGLVWLASVTYDIPKRMDAEFDTIRKHLEKLGILVQGSVSTPKNAAATMETHMGTVITTRTTQELERLSSEAPDYILVCEAAQIEYEAALRLIGRTMQKNAEICFTGTFEQAQNAWWYKDYYNMWSAGTKNSKSYSLPSWTNTKIFTPGERTLELPDGTIVKNCPDPIAEQFDLVSIDYFMERYAGKPVKPSNIVLPEFSNAIHVKEIPYNPDLPVEIAVDPGYGFPGAHALLAVQQFEGRVYLIDELYFQRATTEYMIGVGEHRQWFGAVKYGAIDFAGRQHHADRAPIEIWEAKGIYLDSAQIKVEDSVEVLRRFLKVDPIKNKPLLYVDPKCQGFISECGGGKSPITGGGVWLRDAHTNAISDKNCHSTKALAYWLTQRMGFTPRRPENTAQVARFY